MNIPLVRLPNGVKRVFHLIFMHVEHGGKTLAESGFNLNPRHGDIKKAGAENRIWRGAVAQGEKPPDPHGPFPRCGIVRDPVPMVFTVTGQNLTKMTM